MECYTGGHVLLEDSGSGGFSWEYVLVKDMSSRQAYFTGLCRSCNNLSCCEFRQLLCFFPSVIFFCSEICFPRINCLIF